MAQWTAQQAVAACPWETTRAISAHGVGEYGGLDGDRPRGWLRAALGCARHRPGYGDVNRGGDARRLLSVAKSDFDPGSPLRT